MKRVILLLVAATLMMNACKDSIDVNSDEVKELALEVTIKEIRNQAVPVLILQLFGMHPKLWGYPTYEDCKNAVEDEKAQKIVSFIDDRVKELNFRLKYIRTVEVNKELNIHICEANVDSEESIMYTIKYSIQLTDDKSRIVVKLLELNPTK
jgi:hypothetical protein